MLGGSAERSQLNGRECGWFGPAVPLRHRLVSSGSFLVLLTTLAMAWVSLDVPECSELHARNPTGAELLWKAKVNATGYLREDCYLETFSVDCRKQAPIDGRFTTDGTAAVVGLLVVVTAGVGLVLVKRRIGFRFRAAVALGGALLMDFVSASPGSTLQFAWEGTPARPHVDVGAGPVIGAGLLVAILFLNCVLEFWDRCGGWRKAGLVLVADAGLLGTCAVLVVPVAGGPAMYLLVVPVIPLLVWFVSGRLTGRGERAGGGCLVTGAGVVLTAAIMFVLSASVVLALFEPR